MKHAYKGKLKENVCKSNPLSGGNLISPCNRRMKFVLTEWVEISSRVTGIM